MDIRVTISNFRLGSVAKRLPLLPYDNFFSPMFSYRSVFVVRCRWILLYFGSSNDPLCPSLALWCPWWNMFLGALCTLEMLGLKPSGGDEGLDLDANDDVLGDLDWLVRFGRCKVDGLWCPRKEKFLVCVITLARWEQWGRVAESRDRWFRFISLSLDLSLGCASSSSF